jgi:hypothetical protein
MGPLKLSYEFVDDASTAAGPSRVSQNANGIAARVDVSAVEPDVRYLAAPELQGRLRGTEGSARARAHIVASLKAAGLAPLFGDGFEQPTYPNGPDSAPYAVNVGAIYRASAPDALDRPVAHYDHPGRARRQSQAGADDMRSSVALVAALDSLGRARPSRPAHHVVLLFPDAEKGPPDVRTERMGSSWFWQHPPLPTIVDLALVFDLMGGRASQEDSARRSGGCAVRPRRRGAGLLSRSCADVAPAARRGAVRLQSADDRSDAYRPAPGSRAATITACASWARPFLFLTTGRTETYHTAADTPDTVDYDRLRALSRWVARLAAHAADVDVELGWQDLRADARTDARSLLRLYGAIDTSDRVSWLLRRALAADRRRVEKLLESWDHGIPPPPRSYRTLQLASIRVQAALWHPSGWWFALW